jgi:hypothetical protein
VKPAVVRFYFDADILGVGKLLAGLRPDMTYPGDRGDVIHKQVRPPCLITTPRTKDPVWIPIVSQQGWLSITRDKKITQHQRELDAVMDNAGRMVALAADDAKDTWLQLETVMTQWRKIEELATLPGPFIYTAARTTLAKIA